MTRLIYIQHTTIIIHNVLDIGQSPWVKSYNDLCKNLRNNAKTHFEKDLQKYLVNSIFGITMENVDKRIDVKLITH